MSRPSRRVRQRLAKKFTVSSEAAIQSEQARKERRASVRLSRILVPRSVSVKPEPKFLYRAGQVIANRAYKAPKGDYVGEPEAFQLDSKQFLYRGKGSAGSGLAVSVAKMTNSNNMLSKDNLSQNSHEAPGLFDGKLTIRGPWLPAVTRGAKRSKYGKPKFTPIMSDFDRREKAIKVLLMVALLEACYKGSGSTQDRKEWLLETGPRVLRQFAPLFRLAVSGETTRSIRAQNSGSGKPKRNIKPKPWYHSKDKPETDFRLIQRSAKGKVFQETGAPGGRVLRETYSKK